MHANHKRKSSQQQLIRQQVRDTTLGSGLSLSHLNFKSPASFP